MTVIGPLAQEAPSGFSRGFAIVSDGAFTFMVKANHLPSGDQDRFEGEACN